MSGIAQKLKEYRVHFHTRHLAPAIFIHINKTGGSSIEKALGLPFQHKTALEMRQVVGDRRWHERFSFAFVRNPWDKVASHYHFRVKTNQTGLRDARITFASWVRLAYAENTLPYYDQPKMFMPQIDWISDESGRILVNFVGRFESLEADFSAVCARIDRHATLPHLKRSTDGDYRRHYDDATAEIVARWFARDIDCFSYRFDP